MKTILLNNKSKQAIKKFKFYSCSFQKMFHSQNIIDRIIEFQARLNQQIPQQFISFFKYPSFLKQVTALQLKQFIAINNIPENIVILHALTHIQFNAFSSYVDTYFRFSNFFQDQAIKNDFKKDISKTALQQGKHFQLLSKRLQKIGMPFGNIPVITGLTKSIQQTNQRILQRIAIISLIQQGKGLDAIDRLIKRVYKIQGESQSTNIMNLIGEDQIKHVSIGVKWFKILCQQNNTDQKSELKLIESKFKIKNANINTKRRTMANFPLQWI